MKISNLFLLIAVLFSMFFTACTSEPEIPGEQKEPNTYVAVSLSIASGVLTKASPNDNNYIGEWLGKDTVKSVSVYLVDAFTVLRNAYTVNAAGSTGYSQQTVGGRVVLRPNEAIKSTAGLKNVYVVINETDEIRTVLSTTSPAQFENAFSIAKLSLSNSVTPEVSGSADKIATSGLENDNIVMTNLKKVAFTVIPNVSEIQALQESGNQITVEVQRAVARVMVTSDADTYHVTLGAKRVGTISDITWALAQGENSLFMQQKTDFTTPASTFIPTDSTYIADASKYYDYSGLYKGYSAATNTGGSPVPTLQDYAAAKQNPEVFGMASWLSGQFLLPTTHAHGIKETSGYRKGNTAYVLVRARLTPDSYADGGTPNVDGTFYLGANGKFFTTSMNGVDPAKGGVVGQTVAKHVRGKVLYYAWINPDVLPNVYNSPVLRNNIYHIHITGFKTIGTNWNSLFPENPDNPKDPSVGGNPDPKPFTVVGEPKEPTSSVRPGDFMLAPESAMSFEVKLLPWGVYSYSVELGQ